MSEEDWDAVLRVNLKGTFLTGQAAARQMVAQGGGGAIVCMSSVNGVKAIPSVRWEVELVPQGIEVW